MIGLDSIVQGSGYMVVFFFTAKAGEQNNTAVSEGRVSENICRVIGSTERDN